MCSNIPDSFNETSEVAGGRRKRGRSGVSGADSVGPSVSSKSARTPNPSKKAKNNDTGKKAAHGMKKAKTPSKNESTSYFGVWSIPKFSVVKELLEKGGFSFPRGKFCRPGYSDANEKLDENYFETETDFQKDLCKYGVNDYSKWTKEEKLIIHHWVRSFIISSSKTKGGNEIKYMKLRQNELFPLLKKLGFQKKKTPVVGTDVFCFPGIDPTSANSLEGVNFFQMDGDLRLYLSRSGFPKNCAFDNITSEDLLNLEMMMADQHTDHTL